MVTSDTKDGNNTLLIMYLEKNSDAARLFETISNMSEDQHKDLLKYLEENQLADRRKHPRQTCDLKTGYEAAGTSLIDFIQNIGPGGVFIETNEKFSTGEEITVTLPSSGPGETSKIIGKVVRIESNGVGVKFKMAIQDTILESITQKP